VSQTAPRRSDCDAMEKFIRCTCVNFVHTDFLVYRSLATYSSCVDSDHRSLIDSASLSANDDRWGDLKVAMYVPKKSSIYQVRVHFARPWGSTTRCSVRDPESVVRLAN
jgi:hypothetical protein